MEIVYQPKALEDLKYWKKSGQKQIQARILIILQSIQKTPYEGIGKPEPLNIIGPACGLVASATNIA
jgi:toxin YoeB